MIRYGRRLNEIADGLEKPEFKGNARIMVTGITHDSRKIEQGDIFICITGFKKDGHEFAAAAVKNGAVAVVVERFLDLNVPQLKVKDSRQAAGYLAAALYDYPSKKLELVGVTGTNGKTTVTCLVETIARLAGKKTGLIGTLGTRIDKRILPGQHTTPESTDIQRILGEMAAAGVKTAVMEVSSHALALGRVNGCIYRAGIFTNLTQDHLDYHQTMRDYLEAKSLLFSGMAQSEKNQYAIINADDVSCEYLKQKAACRVVTYGIYQEADYKAENIQFSAQGVVFEVGYFGSRAKVFYATPGKFSVYNALAAFAWGITAGYSLQTVIDALKTIKGVPGRFESIRLGQPFLTIVDYAHTPDGLENVLSTAKEITSGKLVTVFGCGGDRDRTKRPLMGEVAARLSDYAVVTSDNPRTEDPHQIIRDILPGVRNADYKIIEDRREAIIHACSLAGPGDTVVIAGKGHEDYQIIGAEKIHFSDKEEVEKTLRGLGYVG